MILLDTNICIAILHADERVLAHVRSLREEVSIPAMVMGELYYGVAKSSHVEENKYKTDRLLDVLPVCHTSDRTMRLFGALKAQQERNGTRVDDADVMIAATAMEHNAKLVTGNVKHFRRFVGLEIENWFEERHA